MESVWRRARAGLLRKFRPEVERARAQDDIGKHWHGWQEWKVDHAKPFAWHCPIDKVGRRGGEGAGAKVVQLNVDNV